MIDFSQVVRIRLIYFENVEVSKVEEIKIVKPKVVTVETHDLVPAGLIKMVEYRQGDREESEITRIVRCYYSYSQIISDLYSYLGHRCFLGDIEAVKYLYVNAWGGKPALIRTIIELQLHLTAVEIDKDNKGIYSNEFLYYWGMICLGEVSSLAKKLVTAAYCFKKIKTDFPKAVARLAFIGLRKSKEPFKSVNNLRRIYTLRNWVKQGDSFSRIVLSEIMFSHFLEKKQRDNLEPLSIVLSQLTPICQKGHPVALKLFEEIIIFMNTSTGVSNTSDMRIGSGFRVNPDPKDKWIAGFPVNPDTLLDF